MTSPTIKQRLYDLCQKYVNERIDAARQAIADAQNSANEETKSSSGDKYETGRAMAQLEIEKTAQQLGESLKLKSVLDQMHFDVPAGAAETGSLVVTDRGRFFIAISIGKVEVDGEAYMVISPASPLGKQLIGSKSGDTRTFNNQHYHVKELL
ncbi:MAG TPA: GreA/GreB family elongation factor [Chryseosolibacter sp.]|nr:GreA/GreB family elongation factor [Chryseosolibacter sp.]